MAKWSEEMCEKPAYQVSWCEPYDGMCVVNCVSLEEVKAWINVNYVRLGRSYDELTILEISREVDVCELMKQT